VSGFYYFAINKLAENQLRNPANLFKLKYN